MCARDSPRAKSAKPAFVSTRITGGLALRGLAIAERPFFFAFRDPDRRSRFVGEFMAADRNSFAARRQAAR
jgi:hypothetical protein